MPTTDSPHWRNLLLLSLAAGVFLVPGFFLRDLWPPDEVRYMEVAREMAVTGDYLIPRLNGQVYAEKPPLFFWLAAGLYRAGFGFDAGRVVAALATWGTLVLVYFYGVRMMPRTGALLSALVTLTTVLFFQSKGGVLDPLLTFLVVAALGCGSRAFRSGERRRGAWWLGFYALAALGVLTKGPVGLCVPGLVLLVYGLANRKRVRGGGWMHGVGALLFVLMVGGWFIPAQRCGGPGYAREMGINQTVDRLTRSRAHAAPVYRYVVTYPAAFFPWSLLFPLAFAAAVARWRRERDPIAQFLVLWFAVVFVFFSLISGKREGYLMPLVPAVGLMVGRYVSCGVRGTFRWGRGFDWLVRATFVVQGLLGAAFGLFVLGRWPSRWMPPGGVLEKARSSLLDVHGLTAGVLIAGGLLGLSLVGLWLLGKRRLRLGATWCLVVSWLFVSLAADGYVAPGVNRLKSPRPFSEQAKPYLARADKVYLLAYDMSGVYNLYTELTAVPILPRSRGEAWKVMSGGSRVAVIARGHVRREVFGEDCPFPIPVRRGVGGTTMELILNWDPKTGRLVPPPSGSSPDKHRVRPRGPGVPAAAPEQEKCFPVRRSAPFALMRSAASDQAGVFGEDSR